MQRAQNQRWPLAAISALATALIFPGLSTGSDWTRFRGPNGTGVADAGNPPVRLEPSAARWQTPLPAGHSSAVLTEDRIFVTGHEDGRLLTLALDRATGRELWRREAPRPRKEAHHEKGSPVTSTPATCLLYTSDAADDVSTV